jgi:hypothetical protein
VAEWVGCSQRRSWGPHRRWGRLLASFLALWTPYYAIELRPGELPVRTPALGWAGPGRAVGHSVYQVIRFGLFGFVKFRVLKMRTEIFKNILGTESE